MQKKPKSINALMGYMRDVKGINISGSGDKKKLRYMGYFHGYKGYRYHNNPANTYAFNSFDEVQAIYDFEAEDGIRHTVYRIDNPEHVAAIRKHFSDM